MNDKKLKLLISIGAVLAILAVVLFTTGFLNSGKTEINGVQFDLAGFEETEIGPFSLMITGSGGETKVFKTTGKQYNPNLKIGVYDVGGGKTLNESISVSSSAGPYTLNNNAKYGNVTGISVSSSGTNGETAFAFIKDGKLIVLQSKETKFEFDKNDITFSDIVNSIKVIS